jgi:transcriptional regulator with XRE-family HTH domain
MLKLKLVRVSRDLTQWELSHQSDMSQGRYSMIERGLIEPTPEERERLAQILQAPAATLLRQVGQMRSAHSPRSAGSLVGN